jgi:hypothetical protein
MSSRARTIALATISIARRCTTGTGQLARQALIAVIKWLRKLPTAGATFGRLLWWGILVGIISKRVRLFAALVLFIGWMSYLGYAALTKSRSPIVSHAQAAAAEVAVVAEVETSEEGKPSIKAKVVELLSKEGPPPGTVLFILNLSDVRGFDGPGQYLLLLTPDAIFRPNNGNDVPPYSVVGQLRSPGNDITGYGKPAIYRWNDDVRKQYEKLHR